MQPLVSGRVPLPLLVAIAGRLLGSVSSSSASWVFFSALVYELFGRIDFVDQPCLQMLSPMLSAVMSGLVAPGTICGFGTAIVGTASCANAGTTNPSSA